jgi:fructuronate reductase
MGYSSVGEAMTDARLVAFVERMMREDIAVSLRKTRGLDFVSYIPDILKRFRNPALTHTLYQIASDGSQKLPYRILATISEAIAAGRPIDRLVVPVAAWMRFVVRESKEGRALNDPFAGLLASIGLTCSGEACTDVSRLLAVRDVFPPELTSDPRFTAAVFAAYDRFPALQPAE